MEFVDTGELHLYNLHLDKIRSLVLNSACDR